MNGQRLRLEEANPGSTKSLLNSAQARYNLADENRSFEIDMIERLPTPWDLVRSGVAPDHPKIKTVSKVFEKVANEPNFRLFANVELGSDLTILQLKD